MISTSTRQQTRAWRAFAIAIASAAMLLFAGGAKAEAATSPFKLPGMYVWYVNQTEGGDPLKIATRAAKYRIKTVYIKSGDGPNYSFYYDVGKGWQALRENDDGSILSTQIAGGFVGTVLGPFVRDK